MSEFNYSGFESLALRMLRKYGNPLEIRAYSKEGFDPVAGSFTLEYCKTTGFAISVPSVTTGYKFFDDFFVEEMTKGRAKIFILEAKSLDFVPESGHFVYDEGALWEIGTEDSNTGIMPLNPAGTALIYTIGCRIGGRSPTEGTEVTIASMASELRV